MPEGHLVHRYALDQERWFGGRTVAVSSPQGRFGGEAGRLDGRRLLRVEAYGKHLFYWWEGDEIVHVHLGLQGKFLPSPPGTPPLKQSRMHLQAAGHGVDLVAPKVCQLIGPHGRARVVARLGPDPLRDDADPEMVWAAVGASRRPIGSLLIDQTVVSGIGNVLRSEGLFAAAIHPARIGSSLSTKEFRSLWSRLERMMRRAVVEGRIITRRNGRPADSVSETEGRYVYKQERCRRCGSPVEAWELAGRMAYACPRDQPPPASGARRADRGSQTGQ